MEVKVEEREKHKREHIRQKEAGLILITINVVQYTLEKINRGTLKMNISLHKTRLNFREN